MRRAKKSIAAFKVRKGQPVGTSVTLRGERMYEFLDRLMAIALPRVRDFRGVSPKGFDGRGNFTLGLKDQLLFPEIDYMKVDKARGMNVSVVTTARTDQEARKLLQLIGMPFRTQEQREAWPLQQRSRKNTRLRNTRSVCATAAICAAARGRTCASSRCAGSASASWRCRATLRA